MEHLLWILWRAVSLNNTTLTHLCHSERVVNSPVVSKARKTHPIGAFVTVREPVGVCRRGDTEVLRIATSAARIVFQRNAPILQRRKSMDKPSDKLSNLWPKTRR